MKLVWMILAGLLAVAAVLLFLRRNYDQAFVCAALGAVAWFLRYRAQLKEMVRANTPVDESDKGLDSDGEE